MNNIVDEFCLQTRTHLTWYSQNRPERLRRDKAWVGSAGAYSGPAAATPWEVSFFSFFHFNTWGKLANMELFCLKNPHVNRATWLSIALSCCDNLWVRWGGFPSQELTPADEQCPPWWSLSLVAPSQMIFDSISWHNLLITIYHIEWAPSLIGVIRTQWTAKETSQRE
jgi:hypothetical protein